MTTPAVRFEDVTRRFPGVLALDGVSFEIAEGSCHALCGENGAGKSTLGKLLAGIYPLDGGRLFVHGEEARFESPRDALAAGVGMVHQELAFCENLSIAENLCLANLPASRGFVRRREMEERAERMLGSIGVSLDVRRSVGSLTVAQQQMVQITAAVESGASIIVFDEPTSSLSQHEAEQLYALIERLRADGVTCIYVSHRMPEIFQLCDTVTVLRDGRHVATRPVAGLSEADLVRMMIGRELGAYYPSHLEREPGEELLRVEGLSSPGRFEDISFTLHAGEVLGLAGLVGAGRTEVAEALFGLDPDATGTVLVRGQPMRLKGPSASMRRGLGLVPEDRKRQGLVLTESGLHNLSLPILGRLSTASWIHRAEERRLAGEYFRRLRVRSPSLDFTVAGLSGGNQQKVVLARWLAARSSILLLDEPTRGVDVGAKAEIHALIDELASAGNAILLISSELPEVISLSSRILVLRDGRAVAEVPRAEASQDRLLRLMAGLGEAVPLSPH
ncbi:MAG TPA: sugar ABC transporter ATP-binding protein [Longimicrobiaceae bacterium]|nr:sugar ABC transporter ATP-binding protein [Longimicrobiaceae bacterium]